MSVRAEWLERRRTGVGASDVAGILGLSPWASPWSVWADKVGLTPLDDAGTESQEFGLMAEPMLKRYFEARTGLTVIGEQTEMSHLKHEWMRCTLDGYVVGDPTITLGVYEAKTTSEPASAWDDGPPVHYQCQATWQMAVTGAERVWFGVLHLAFGRPQFRVYEFARDEADLALIVDRVTTFWNDHVLTGIAPPTDGTQATTDALAGAWGTDDGSTVEADPQVEVEVSLLRHLKDTAKELEAQIAASENAIRAHLGEASTLAVNGVVLATWKAQDRTTVDTKALRAAHPELAEQFTTTSTNRVLRIKSPKGE